MHYYFLKHEDFQLNENDLEITINPKLTKKELEFLTFLLDRFKVTREYTQIELNKFKVSKEIALNLISSINKKSINIIISREKNEISNISFNFFEMFVLEDDTLIFSFSKNIRLAYKTGNLFNRINLLGVLKYNSPYTYNFYKFFIKTVPNIKRIHTTISLKDLRSILNVPHEKYNRFYDFESKILKPVIKDFEDFGIYQFSITYNKIKDKDGKGNRIKELEFIVVNSYFIDINSDTNKLLKKYNDSIDDFSYAYKVIYNYRKIHGLEKTKDYIESNLSHVFIESN